MRSFPAARLVLLALAAGIIPACVRSSRTNTTNPVLFTGGGAVTLNAVALSGGQEVPPLDSGGSGSVTIQVDQTRMFLQVTVNHAGLTDITEAHIHAGPVGVDGPIIFSLASGPFASPLVITLTETNLLPSFASGINTFADAVNAIVSGQTYVNIHTAAFTGGEIRGQVGPAALQANLDGSQAVPPVVSPLIGTMILQLSNDQTTVNFNLSVSDPTNVTTAQIHAGAPGSNGAVLFTLAAGPNLPAITGTMTSANFQPQAAAGILSFDAAVDALLSGKTYVDVQTTIIPSGEIRGQILGSITPLSPPTIVVPPTTPTGPSSIISPPTIVIPPY